MFLMGNNNSQTKAKGMIARGVGDKELEIRLSTTVFWAIYSNRHAILARNIGLSTLITGVNISTNHNLLLHIVDRLTKRMFHLS